MAAPVQRPEPWNLWEISISPQRRYPDAAVMGESPSLPYSAVWYGDADVQVVRGQEMRG